MGAGGLLELRQPVALARVAHVVEVGGGEDVEARRDLVPGQLGAVVAQPGDLSRLGDDEVEGADEAEVLGGDRLGARVGGEQRQRPAAARRLVGQPGRLDPVEDHRHPPLARVGRQPGAARLEVEPADQAGVLRPPLARGLPGPRPELIPGLGEKHRPLRLGVD